MTLPQLLISRGEPFAVLLETVPFGGKAYHIIMKKALWNEVKGGSMRSSTIHGKHAMVTMNESDVYNFMEFRSKLFERHDMTTDIYGEEVEGLDVGVYELKGRSYRKEARMKL